MHLNARINTSGDHALNLHALARKWVLIVPIAVIRSEAASLSYIQRE